MNKDQEIIQGFRSSAKTMGLLFVTIALICNFIPAVYVSTITGQFPSVSQLLQLWLAAAAAFGVGYIVQPVSFFPIVNMAGTFMCWICGNVGEVRAPAANMAQKVTNCEQGTPKAEIMSCIGICASVFVTVIMISFFALVGAQVMPLMPKFVMKMFGFVLPCVLGAVYADLASKNFVLGVIILLSSLAGIMIVPKLGIPGGLTMLINIIIAVLIARAYFMATNKK
ncbi:MAG: hypothetical protein IJQ30_01035 [Acidaminococcaceae bacterium]|nr:hypothetical protein [Acidaminococcaceae bacterium]MBQ6912825.1 hypothetical protein [Acidaminococcaceae bacterium]